MASLRPVLQPRVHERFLDAPRSFGKNGDAGRRHLPCVCHNHACRSVNGFAWCVTSRLSIRLQEHVYMFCQFSHHKFLLFDWMFGLRSHPWFRALSLTDFSVAFILLFDCLFDFSFVFVGDTFAFARLFHTSRCTLLCWYAFFQFEGRIDHTMMSQITCALPGEKYGAIQFCFLVSFFLKTLRARIDLNHTRSRHSRIPGAGSGVADVKGQYPSRRKCKITKRKMQCMLCRFISLICSANAQRSPWATIRITLVWSSGRAAAPGLTPLRLSRALKCHKCHKS